MRPLINVVAIWLAASPIVIDQGFDYQQFDVPGARLTRPFGVNASGAIVGLYRDASNVGHGFLREPAGAYSTIDYPGATFTNASSINARGDVVGRWTDTAGANHAYLMTRQGTFYQIDPPAPCIVTTLQTVIHGINDVRDLVGRCFDAFGKELAWIWEHGGSFRVLDNPQLLTTDAWLLTNAGAVVGDYTDASHFVHGYTWTQAEGLVTLDFPSMQTGLRAMNQRGDVTGIYSDDQGRFHGFLLRDGSFETIDHPDAVNGGGTLVINNSGLMVGGFIDASGREHGFIAR